ncbi:MAG: response regulator [Alphaproteobacteria bacterium]|nr:response regulator [Alphaproteobacteria bacterium]MBF0130051.1 response regulator [Alphaproteobacteria bacterium]
MDLPEAIRNAKILIVDDTQVNVILLEAILSNSGYLDVTGVTDPRKVEAMHRERRYDLILLDIQMPHLDGFRVMEILSRDLCGDYLPVVVLTALNDRETRLRALEMGAKDFLTKPFEQSEVLHRIHNMLEVRMLYAERQRRNEILEERVRERTRDLEENWQETIRCLARAGEFRDNETGRHLLRMSKIAHRIALAIGLPDEQADIILAASCLHDLGKIGIPDRVLLKPGSFDDEEWAIMRSHVAIGCRILGEHPSPLLRTARTVILHHHEKWDGSGYPNGVKGEEISIEGRICAVSDVFDALTSERPYKKAWPVEKAVALLNEEAGRHFDPALIETFNLLLPEILAIRAANADDAES